MGERDTGVAVILSLALVLGAGFVYFFHPDILGGNGKTLAGALAMAAVWALVHERKLVKAARRPAKRK